MGSSCGPWERGLQLSNGDHRLDWGHQVGVLLQQWFDNWLTTPPEGSPATPGVPGVPPLCSGSYTATTLGPSHCLSSSSRASDWSLLKHLRWIWWPAAVLALGFLGPSSAWMLICPQTLYSQQWAASLEYLRLFRSKASPTESSQGIKKTKAGYQVWGLLLWSQRGSIRSTSSFQSSPTWLLFGVVAFE